VPAVEQRDLPEYLARADKMKIALRPSADETLIFTVPLTTATGWYRISFGKEWRLPASMWSVCVAAELGRAPSGSRSPKIGLLRRTANLLLRQSASFTPVLSEHAFKISRNGAGNMQLRKSIIQSDLGRACECRLDVAVMRERPHDQVVGRIDIVTDFQTEPATCAWISDLAEMIR